MDIKTQSVICQYYFYVPEAYFLHCTKGCLEIFRGHPFHSCDGFASIKEGGGGGLAVGSKYTLVRILNGNYKIYGKISSKIL
jgi:hypothetical protein